MTRITDQMQVTLEVKGQAQIVNLSEKLKSGGIDHKLWIEQPENIPTCLATKPYPKSIVSSFFKKLKLCKWEIAVTILQFEKYVTDFTFGYSIVYFGNFIFPIWTDAFFLFMQCYDLFFIFYLVKAFLKQVLLNSDLMLLLPSSFIKILFFLNLASLSWILHFKYKTVDFFCLGVNMLILESVALQHLFENVK